MKIFIPLLYVVYLTFCPPLNVTAGERGIDLEPSGAGLEYYKAGMEAARIGEDEQAVTAFEAALKNGYDVSRLHYNLGVVLLRLGQRTRADRAFRRAANDPELAALAEYNMGLIALDRGHMAMAGDRFGRAGSTAQTPELQLLAARAIDRLPPEPDPFMMIAELTAGYDDAASIRSDDQGGGDKNGDLFAGFWLYADHWLTGNTYRGIQAFGSLYSLLYAEESDSDLLMLEAGAVMRQPVDIWDTGARITGRHNRLDGDQFENSAELSFEGSRLLLPDDQPSGSRISLRYRLEMITGGSGYTYLSGTKQDVRARISMPLQKGRLTSDYTIEHNDRDDLRTAEQFTSSSPLRHRFGVSYSQPLNKSLYLYTAASWRTSRFGGSDTLVDGSTLQRKDSRLALSGALSYRRPGRWTPFIRGEWISNSSNIAYYDYDQLRVSAGAEWLL